MLSATGQFTCLQVEQSSPTVMDVFERFIESFWALYGNSLTVDQRRALQAILQCRTAALGHCR